MISVKQAAATASRYLEELYSEVSPQGIQLEEVELSPDRDYWLITLSFVDSGNPLGKALAGITGVPRTYKTIKIDSQSGEAVSMKIRQLT